MVRCIVGNFLLGGLIVLMWFVMVLSLGRNFGCLISFVCFVIVLYGCFVLEVWEIMLCFLLVLFVVFFGLLLVIVCVDIEVGFWICELGFEFFYVFFMIKGMVDGKLVEEIYGFIVKMIIFVLLWGLVLGWIDIVLKGYMYDSNRFYIVIVFDVVYFWLKVLV